MKPIFISYSHDSEDHKQRVSELAGRLRNEGIEVIVDADKLPGGPDEGWPAWSPNQVRLADKVLIVASRIYKDIYECRMPPTGGGFGCASEIAIIKQEVYDSAGINPKYRVVVLREPDGGCIPVEMKRYQSFHLPNATGFKDLTDWIRGVCPATPAPPSAITTPAPCVTWPDPPPSFTRKQADRNDQFQAFAEMVTGRSSKRILLLRGASNSGKTGLLREMEEYARSLPLIWARADFKGAEGLESILSVLALEFEPYPGVLAEFVGADASSHPNAFLKGLSHHAAPLVIALDSYEQANPEAQSWVEGQFLGRVDRLDAVVVVIGGQSVPDSGKYPWGSRSILWDMPPLTEPKIWLEYTHRVLGYTHVDRSHIEAFSHAYKGDPGLISAAIITFARAHFPLSASGKGVQSGGGVS